MALTNNDPSQGRHGETGIDQFAVSPLPKSRLVRLLLLAVTLAAIGYALDAFRFLGLTLYSQQYLAIVLAIALPAAYLGFPLRPEQRDRPPPLYDICAAILGFAASAYLAVTYPALLDRLYANPPEALVAGSILIVLILEALRRTVGLTLVIVVLFFIGLGLLAHMLPGDLQGRQVDVRQLVVYLGLDSNSILGLPLMICATVIVSFIVFGELLGASGGTRFFTDLAAATMGRYRGGASKMAVVASSLFGSVSGSAVSNVVSTGVITIPLMRRTGLAPHQAGAIEAVASTGGQLLPPIMGAAAFLMAELLQVSYSTIALAALVPALLYYIAIFIIIDLLAGREGIGRIDQSTVPSLKMILSKGWHYTIPFVVIVWSLFIWNRPPETAAAFGIFSVLALWLLFSGYTGRLRIRSVFTSLISAGHASVGMLMIGAAAGIIIGTLNISSVGFALTLALVDLSDGNVLTLLVMGAAVCIVLGMGMPTVGVYILLASLVAPSLVQLGIPLITAHLFVLYFGMMSMITPPVAIAAFAGAKLAGATPMRTAVSAIKFGWTAYIIPFLFVFEPALTLDGSVANITVTLLFITAGIWAFSITIIGYMSEVLSWPQRMLFGAIGIVLMLPKAMTDWWIWAQIAALAGFLVLVFVLSQRRGQRGAALNEIYQGRARPLDYPGPASKEAE